MELDASQYISVFLLNEISRLFDNEGKAGGQQIDVKAKCATAIDRFPNKIWEKASDYVEYCEDRYMSSDDDEDDEAEDSDETKN